jgi:hypothetical protein
MRRIVYTMPDGHIEICHPTINTFPIREAITEAEAEQRAMTKDIPAVAINPRFIESSEIPVDRIFRNAWEDNGGVKVNMPKAREIHRDKLRALRRPVLEALDNDYLRADEQGDTAEKARIAVKKQALRDVTNDPAIANATTPEQLRSVLPAALG